VWAITLTVLFALVPVLGASADVDTSVKLRMLTSFVRLADETWGLAGIGQAETSLETKTRNAKARLTLDATIADLPLVEITYATVTARFPRFRLTGGRTRLSWGEGFFFNAGDLLFGSTSAQADLTAEELRTSTTWLASAYVPLGIRSFAEAVVLPPVLVVSNPTALTQADRMGEITDTSVGGRILTEPAETKLEGGYLYRGTSQAHEPYVSFQGNVGVDWHLSASTAIRSDPVEDFVDGATISMGLFRAFAVGYRGTISARVEALVRPDGRWWSSEAGTNEGAAHGLMLYPEVSYSPLDSVNVLARSVVSPIDGSALSTVGARWNPFESFTLFGFATVQAGETDDMFGFERDGGVATILGIEYSY
jgi:hypothetical protein